jgi:hypothetical protein
MLKLMLVFLGREREREGERERRGRGVHGGCDIDDHEHMQFSVLNVS